MIGKTQLLLLKGFFIGLIVSAPVGPVAILSIRRTISKGLGFGLVTGLGAALADTLFGALAACGVNAISQLLFEHETQLQWAGGIFLCVLGVHSFLKRPVLNTVDTYSKREFFGAFASAFLLMLTNPITIFAFIAVMPAFGAASVTVSFSETGTLIAGVFIGCLTWWSGLSFAMTFVKKRFSLQSLNYVNGFSGILLIIFGIVALVGMSFKEFFGSFSSFMS